MPSRATRTSAGGMVAPLLGAMLLVLLEVSFVGAETHRADPLAKVFWEYHDVVFAEPPQAAPEDLRRYAKQVGLDLSTFEGCLSGGVHRAAVQRDVDEARRLGLDGTPAFFVNGRPLSGAQPLEAFVRVIDEELTARKDPSVGAR